MYGTLGVGGILFTRLAISFAALYSAFLYVVPPLWSCQPPSTARGASLHCVLRLRAWGSRRDPNTGMLAHRGATDGMIAKLETFRWPDSGPTPTAAPTAGAGSASDSEDDTDRCTICLAAFEGGDAMTALPCHPRHVFHAQCIVPWLKRQRFCPLCQRDINHPPPRPAKSQHAKQA